MTLDVAMFFFVVFNSFSSFGTMLLLWWMKRDAKDDDVDVSPHTEIEKNLNTRLHELQTAQFRPRQFLYDIRDDRRK